MADILGNEFSQLTYLNITEELRVKGQLVTIGGVVGAPSSTDNAITIWDGTSGLLVGNSAVLIGEAGQTNPDPLTIDFVSGRWGLSTVNSEGIDILPDGPFRVETAAFSDPISFNTTTIDRFGNLSLQANVGNTVDLRFQDNFGATGLFFSWLPDSDLFNIVSAAADFHVLMGVNQEIVLGAGKVDVTPTRFELKTTNTGAFTEGIFLASQGPFELDVDTGYTTLSIADIDARGADSLVTKDYADFEAIGAKNNAETGVMSGMVISGTLFVPASINISAGTGYIIDNSDPVNPIRNRVDFAGVTAFDPGLTSGTYVVTINAAGTVGFIDSKDVTSKIRRDFIIPGFIGIQTVPGPFNLLVSIGTEPTNLGYGGGLSFLDFFRDVIGPANVTGNIISANGVNLSLDNTGGDIFVLGANFRADPNDPDNKMIVTGTAFPFLRVLRGLGGNLQTDGAVFPTVIDPTMWDNAGVLTAVTVNDFTIQVVYITSAGSYVVAFGQEVFNTLNDAETALANGTFFYEEFSGLQQTVRRCFLIVQQSATDLTDITEASFNSDGKFRVGGTSATGAIPGINTPGGLDTNVQFNAAGVFGGSSDFTWDGAQVGITGIVAVTGTATITGRIDALNLPSQALEGTFTDASRNWSSPDVVAPSLLGLNNVMLGGGAGRDVTNVDESVFIGVRAGQRRTDGNTNVAIGYEAGRGDGITAPTGINNVTIGAQAGAALTIGFGNVFLGTRAGEDVTEGSRNVIVGQGSGQNLTTGIENTIVGGASAVALTTGSLNILIGLDAGDSLIDGNNNIIIGPNLDPPTGSTSDYINIGSTFFADRTTKSVRITDGGATTLNAGASLELATTNQALLVNRLTTAQIVALTTPVDGMIVYNTSLDKFQGRANGIFVNLN